MKAEDFVKQHYPNSYAISVTSNHHRQRIYIIMTGNGGLETVTYHPHPCSDTASSAWVNAKKFILSEQITTTPKQ